MRPYFFCLAFFGATVLTACAQQKAAMKGPAPAKTEAWYVGQAPFKMTVPVLPQFAARTVSVTEFGASGDGHTLNTAAFARAIEACAAAGGGRVVVPAGLWLTGPIEFKSGINLVVERGAVLQFTDDHTQYPTVKLGGSSNYTVTPPVWGYKLKNVAITGEGIIDGAGDSWRPVKKNKVTASQWKDLQKSGVVSTDGSIWWPSKEAMEGEAYLKTLKDKPDATAADYAPARTFLRPHMVQFNNCENVLVEGVTIRNSPKFVFYPGSCNNLTMRHVSIFNEWWAQNGDGIDISACKNVLVYKCTVSAGDDGICMKSSGTSKDGGPKLENVVVAGCTVYHGHGGFVIGSNTDGGMNNIFVSDCNFIGTDIGIRVKSNAGRGGLVHNVFLRDIYMSDIQDEAVSFDTYYEDVPAGAERGAAKTAQDKIPELRDFTISNVYCRGAATGISITGLPGAPVQNITFNNVLISAQKAYEAKDAKAISFTNSKVLLPGGAVKDLAQAAFDPFAGLTLLPHSSIDRAEFDRQYAAYPALWDKAFAFLKERRLAELAPGKYSIAGDSAYVSVTYGPEKEFAATKWEAHRRYIDLQYIASGKEKMGVAPVTAAKLLQEYNDTKDVAHYEAEGKYYEATPGTFFIFFPQDAHRPSIKVEEGDVRKVVIKILAAPAR